MREKATRDIVLEAVAEIRPPLITATLAMIVSFLPMFFITGMMGPYMAPMALNVPVAMLMSMVVAFTITPWMAYHGLHRKFNAGGRKRPWPPRSRRPGRYPRRHGPLQDLLPLDGAPASFAASGLAFLLGIGGADRRGDGPGGHARRTAQDAAV